jgi:hypothetical protein
LQWGGQALKIEQGNADVILLIPVVKRILLPRVLAPTAL